LSNVAPYHSHHPSRIASAFDHEDWVFEWKADGWRCVAYVENGSCELVSRNGNVYKSFTRLTKELAKLPVKSAIIDDEVVCLDGEGKSVFLD
jgi:bifunctional non-homologous end joining protein LigD